MVSELFSHLCLGVASKLANASQLAWVLDYSLARASSVRSEQQFDNAQSLQTPRAYSEHTLTLQMKFMNRPVV